MNQSSPTAWRHLHRPEVLIKGRSSFIPASVSCSQLTSNVVFEVFCLFIFWNQNYLLITGCFLFFGSLSVIRRSLLVVGENPIRQSGTNNQTMFKVPENCFLLHPEAHFQTEQAVVSMSRCLNSLSCCVVIGWFPVCANERLGWESFVALKITVVCGRSSSVSNRISSFSRFLHLLPEMFSNFTQICRCRTDGAPLLLITAGCRTVTV